MTGQGVIGEASPWLAPHPPVAARPITAVDRWRAVPHDEGLTITSRVRVDGDEQHLRGHFPNRPVFPGVFAIEAVCQAMAAATAAGVPPPELRVLRSARFTAPLLGGDELTLEIAARPHEGGWAVVAHGTRRDGTPAVRITADFGPGGGRDA
ncbi:3-hydroxyacyl-ACP dehydratase [Saccharothrix obliqua]|uniref:3-hydroxyacyl-ACP dehydratase n=1 Tax=Saccharothrix obliqua TaxID=2861747 RepID=UPI001C5F155F|nr:3-hydroxyacyl-ACP dehydratase [Saccharothrix obliqua]MBW4721847.1 3-hydroxyacyl-ACP dehydratase [Saccharothrix obliqua]